MKKRVVSTIVVGILLIILYRVCMPTYKVYNSFITMGQNYKETELNIVIYKHHNSEELYKSIETEYNRINGQPTQLTMNLYYTGNAIRKGHKPYRIIYIDYDTYAYSIE